METATAPLNEYEDRRLATGDLSDAIHSYKNRTGCTLAVARTLVYARVREISGAPPETKKYVGYHDDAELPVKPGMMVTILKGTLVSTVGRGTKPAGRTYKVKIDHILNGTFRYRDHREETHHTTNPSIRWAGPGGYWSAADINDIPEAL